MKTDRPHITWLITILTILVYGAGNPYSWWLWPVDSGQFRPIQLVSYMLCHGNWLHLGINILALLSFGPALERTWGHGKFLLCYVLCGVAGGALALVSSTNPIVGASGALFGLFAAYTIANPRRTVISLIPWPLPAWTVLALYVAVSALAYAMSWLPNIAHLAHIGGVVVGLAFGLNNKPPAR